MTDGSHMHDERILKVYVTIDLPDGTICRGSGPSIEEAFSDAKRQIEISRIPKHGPWKWEKR